MISRVLSKFLDYCIAKTEYGIELRRLKKENRKLAVSLYLYKKNNAKLKEALLNIAVDGDQDTWESVIAYLTIGGILENGKRVTDLTLKGFK